MTRPTTKKKLRAPPGAAQPSPPLLKGAAVSRLRAQTRKQLGKHYRAKYGVR